MKFKIIDTNIGKAVLSTSEFKPGGIILQFKGKAFKRKDVDDISKYLQINTDQFIGPSGGIDDYINHSCNPNCFVKIEEDSAYLVAIKNIEPNEELTFDYSTTSTDNKDQFNLKCQCGAENCRKLISGFKSIDLKTKINYITKDIFPNYILDLILDSDN